MPPAADRIRNVRCERKSVTDRSGQSLSLAGPGTTGSSSHATGVVEVDLLDTFGNAVSIDDPLSKFNRHELEQFFERWALERDRNMVRLLKESHGTGRDIASMIPPDIAARLRRVRI